MISMAMILQVISGGYSTVLRFSKEYDYGDKEDAWKNTAEMVSGNIPDILFANVYSREYGDVKNEDLMERECKKRSHVLISSV